MFAIFLNSSVSKRKTLKNESNQKINDRRHRVKLKIDGIKVIKSKLDIDIEKKLSIEIGLLK
jgi:hypothetical protein